MNNLSDTMQERLDRWRKNTLPVVATQKIKNRNYVSRGDYGDDMRDIERKDAEAWQREIDTNPMYRR